MARSRTLVAYTSTKNELRAIHQLEPPLAVLATCLVTTPPRPTEFEIRCGSTPTALASSPRPETAKNAAGKENTNSR